MTAIPDRALAEAIAREIAESLDRVMACDDKFAGAQKEIERRRGEIESLKCSCVSYRNGRDEALKLLRGQERRREYLLRQKERLENEFERLTERAAIMEVEATSTLVTTTEQDYE